jgi:hypothetical protein
MLSACVCSFQRTQGSEWEMGIAITSAPGFHNIVVMLPGEATTVYDALSEVWKYNLLPYLGAFMLPSEEQ